VINWDNDAWGSSLLDEMERIRVRAEGPVISKDDVLDEIIRRTRNIVKHSSDSHTAELADCVLVLTAMLKSETKT